MDMSRSSRLGHPAGPGRRSSLGGRGGRPQPNCRLLLDDPPQRTRPGSGVLARRSPRSGRAPRWPPAAPGHHGSAGIGDPYFPLDGNGGIDVLSYDVHDRYGFAPAGSPAGPA